MRNISVKNLVLLYLLIFSHNILVAQETFIGINGTIGLPNSNTNTGIGLSINGEYQTNFTPFAVRLSAKVYNAEFDNSIKDLVTYNYIFKTIECNLLFIPFRETARPYIGLGIGYNIINIEQGGNIIIIGDKFVKSKDPKNSINYNIILGSSFLSKKTFSVFFELLYQFINFDYKVELEDQYANKSTIDKSINLNNLLLNIGFRIML